MDDKSATLTGIYTTFRYIDKVGPPDKPATFTDIYIIFVYTDVCLFLTGNFLITFSYTDRVGTPDKPATCTFPFCMLQEWDRTLISW